MRRARFSRGWPLGGALPSELELDPVLRELALLQVAHTAGCEYERLQHTAIAAAAGVGPDQIAALAMGDLAGPAFTPLQAQVLACTVVAVRQGRMPAPIAADLSTLLGLRRVVELLLVIGYYLGLAVLAESVGLHPDKPAGTAVVDVARAQASS